MYRPFLFVIIFFVLGILGGSIIKSSFIFLIIGIVSLFCLVIGKNFNKKKLFLGFVIFFLGAFYFGLWTKNVMGNVHKYVDSGQITVIGYIYRAPNIKQNKVVYDVKTLYIDKGSKIEKIKGNVRISTLPDKKGKIYSLGDVIKIKGKLKMPKGKRNFGGFDYRAYLFQKGITTTMFSREIKKIGTFRINPLMKLAFISRNKIIDFISKNLPRKTSALLSGLVLGIKEDIPRGILSDFQDTGLMHLLAVSGLHVGIIYKMLQELFYYTGLSLKFSFFLQGLLIVFYCILSGLTPSVVRATIMILIVILSNLTLRRYDSLNSLSLAAFIVLLKNPLNLFSISFQLSFCATLGIIIFYRFFENYLSKLPKFLRESTAAGISAQIIVCPFLAYYFNKVSIIGILTTPLVAPLASTALILGFIASIFSFCFLSLAKILVKVSGFLILIMEKIVGFFARIPFSYIIIPQIDPLLIFIYFIFLALSIKVILKKQNTKVKQILVFVMIFTLIIVLTFRDKSVEVTFIDVGQGDSIFIRTDNNKTILIDGGGIPSGNSETFDIGRDIIKPFLYAKGVRSIDIMVLTHFDIDHVQGLLSLMDEMPVGMILYGMPDGSNLYKQMVNIAKNRKIKVARIGREDKFYIGNVLFEVLHPSKENINYTSNDSSVVIRMTYGQAAFLFTGDLEHLGEKEVLTSYNDIQADVLKLGHHGSRTSTSKEFLDAVNPKFAVISVGKDNNFNHPSLEILNLLKNKSIKVLRTDIQGGITFKIYDKGVKIQTTIS